MLVDVHFPSRLCFLTHSRFFVGSLVGWLSHIVHAQRSLSSLIISKPKLIPSSVLKLELYVPHKLSSAHLKPVFN